MLTQLTNLKANNRATSSNRPIHPTIEVINAHKHYGFWGSWRHVLRNLNLSIYGGEIYTVVGPHGCGKSTVIKVILGLEKLNQGTVKVFGFTPGHELSGIPGIRVGYTPKENGLYQDFTISETFHYYGHLLGLRKSYVLDRINFLSNLLNIPITSNYLRHYSEGVKRQLSFAVAILHEPDLLVLDEPCFGLDPILKRSMWEYMKELTQTNTTILLTTQNCDEARWSDKTGFMRNGQIILEGNPNELLTKFEEKSLERLYCRAYMSNPDKIDNTRSPSMEENPQISLEPLKIVASEGFMYTGNDLNERVTVEPRSIRRSDRRFDSLRKIRDYFLRYKRFHVLLKRDFLISIRRCFWLLMFLFLPSIYLLVFCISIGPAPYGLLLGIVNYETNEELRLEFMSCRLLWNIDNTIITQRSYATYTEAYKAARNLELWGILLINENCTAYVREIVTALKVGHKNFTDFDSPFLLMLDTTSPIIATRIEKEIKHAVGTLLHQLTGQTNTEQLNIESQLLDIREHVYGMEFTPNTEYMAPGLAIAFIFHSVAFVLAVVTVSYRIQCVTARNFLAGVKLEESILAHMICFGTFSLAQSIIMFFLLLELLKIPNYGYLHNILLIIIMQIICGISFGIAVGMSSGTIVSSGAWVFSSLVATMILCGIQWPLESLPKWLCDIVKYLPLTRSVEAVRTVLQRGTSLNHPHVYLGIIVPLVWLLIFTILYVCRNRVV